MANFELQKFNFKFGQKEKVAFEFDSKRYTSPKQLPEVSERYLKYANAQKLAADIQLSRNCRHFVVVNGSFVFGDFLEAIIKRYNFHVKRLIISTLSLNQNNVDSLGNLLEGGYVDKLDLIVSWFFFAHERHREGLVPYLYKELDKNDKFQLAAARTHCKIAQLETHDGVFINIHGSANLRASDNVEQIVIEDSENLYRFNEEWRDSILKKYSTINKKISGGSKQLWETIEKAEV